MTGQNSYIANNFGDFINQHPSLYMLELMSVRDNSWETQSFESYDTLIHAAALVHQSTKNATLEQYDKVNCQLSIELAKKAKRDGVKHFIFLSTMSVYGLNTGHITVETSLNPKSLYGHSKAKAEEALLALDSTDFTVTIIRAPMIYGPNCKGNFRSLHKIANISPIFPKVNNRRSAIFIDNFSEFLKVVVDEKLEGILYPQDKEYLNTSDTVSLISQYSSKNIYISKLAGLGVNFLLFSPVIQKAFGSLTYDRSLPGGPNNLEYNKISFDESIKKSTQNSDLNSNNKNFLVLQRPLDIIFSATGLVVASPLLIGATAIGYLDTGSPLFIQERVGKDQKPFNLIKFRTMKVSTESVASHLVDNTSITKLGKVLRKTKLDELPQLINVLKGEMSLVGPRPNLFNQKDLIEARDKIGVYEVLPGITGLAQLSGIDMSTPERLAKKDKEMIDTINLKNYFSYILSTALGKGSGDAVK